MVEQHGKVLQRARGQLTRRLVGDPATGVQPADVNGVSFVDTVKTLIEVMNQERLVHGLPTANMRQKVMALVSNVTGEDASVALQNPEVAAAAHERLRLVAAQKGGVTVPVAVTVEPQAVTLEAPDVTAEPAEVTARPTD